jgi:SAM-dependent MidA family methyltransferase
LREGGTIHRLQTELVQFIRETIRNRGPQSFAWFMEQALYHPQHGYYSSGRAAIGRRGDYFTNVSVGPLFGQLLSAQFAEMWQRLGNSGQTEADFQQRIDNPEIIGHRESFRNFIIVEQGAHHGEFARDLLETSHAGWPEFFQAIRYLIIEPFSILRARQSETLREFEEKVSWKKSLTEVDPFVGVHFSNELLDSMPVHLIVSTGRGWLEKFVAIEREKFVFVDQAIVDPTLKARVALLPERAAGYETEVNLAVLDWIDNVSAKLIRGYVIAIDYGFGRDEFYAPHRTAGTLQVRAQHRRLASPFEQIGHADISAHVDWTSLAEHAEERGLRVHGFTDQHHFITGILSELLREEVEKNTDPKNKRTLQTLLHPEMLGRAFQVLALGKDVDRAVPLAGFKFARDARWAIGI